MVNTIGETGKQQLQMIVDKALASDALTSAFAQQHITLIPLATIEEINQCLCSTAIDAIIIGQQLSPDTIVLPQDQQPLILAVQEAADKPLDNLDALDGILPAYPTAMAFQVRQQIEQRRDRDTSRAQLASLEHEIAFRKRKVREIELLKNAIVRNVSHELRTPLLQVKSAVALIGEDASDDSLINYAQNAVARLETHVKNITMLGHSLETNLSPIILRDAIEYAKRNLTRIWTRRTDAERIHINLEPNLPPILADKQGLSTVLQLLMDNALKFGDDKDIEVIGRRAGDKIYVAVRDNGIGIAEDKLQDIFESFYQVDDTSTRPYGGAGVGLALVKLILENHDIDIHVDSTLNVGSTFWFELTYMQFEDL